MMRALRVPVSEAMQSALECRGLEIDYDPAERAILRSWHGSSLVIEPGDFDMVLGAIIDASNAEDAQAEADGCPFARRASRSLSALSGRIVRAYRRAEGAL